MGEQAQDSRERFCEHRLVVLENRTAESRRAPRTRALLQANANVAARRRELLSPEETPIRPRHQCQLRERQRRCYPIEPPANPQHREQLILPAPLRVRAREAASGALPGEAAVLF